jgi:uncharacterized protein (DUF1800 family)
MRRSRDRAPLVLLLVLCIGLLAGSGPAAPSSAAGAPLRPGELPWRAAGLDERQAAAHLLSRFAYGPRPGEVERVVAHGLERWFEDQLASRGPDAALERRLATLPALRLSPGEMAATYPNGGLVLAQARREGVLPVRESAREDEAPAGEGAGAVRRDPATLRRLVAFVEEQRYRRQGELIAALLTQKLVRAVATENQLAEVMTDFWFNHFNVSLTDPECRAFVLAFERDAIRPHALGRFDELLAATARQPAMLLYLDNARSVAGLGDTTTLERELASRQRQGGFGSPARRAVAPRRPRRATGLNENYARELLELHTLGVDGGYTQRDVVEVARAFTGWSVVPPRALLDEGAAQRLDRALGSGLGFVRQGEFLFRADAHDAGAKQVLDTRLPAGRGMEDGEQVLALLAAHPATARHLARKLAVRFVADDPPAALVDRLAATFTASGGDTRALLRQLVRAPELWAPTARLQKVKSPFELAVSALRALGAEVHSPAAVLDWVARMGQPLYAQQAPTGWLDEASTWVSGGALVARMNFALALAAGQLPGVSFTLSGDPLAGIGNQAEARNHAGVAGEAELRLWAARLLPGRELDADALGRLAPLLAASTESRRFVASAAGSEDPGARRLRFWQDPFPEYRRGAVLPPNRSAQARIAGVLLGSPEFQRR